jgi:tetratricopeptide (TPR) repeat protein
MGFLVGAGIDWLWQLSAIGAVALALLGLLTVSGVSQAFASRRERGAWRGIGWTAIALAAAVPLSAALLAELYLDQSRAAASIPNVAAARAAARNAEALEPWSPDPRLQLALLDEQSRRLVSARREIDAALAKSRDDWSIWLVRSRIELRLGEVTAARRSLRRAAALNPESSLFPGVTHSTP